MRVENELYKKQGIHVISAIFTVEEGKMKVLLIKRKKDPYKDSWALIGGALYNNENLNDGMKREIKEKSAIKIAHFHSKSFYYHTFCYPYFSWYFLIISSEYHSSWSYIKQGILKSYFH